MRPANEYNLLAARTLARFNSRVEVVDATKQPMCPNCDIRPVEVFVDKFRRCEPCANHLVTLVSTMRSHIHEGE